jgi:hypothetical protein
MVCYLQPILQRQLLERAEHPLCRENPHRPQNRIPIRERQSTKAGL